MPSANKYIDQPSTVHQLSRSLESANAPALLQRDDIQGLRAIAVMAVILFHTNKNWLPGGFVGVDVFLVISGFLITSIISRQQQSGRFKFSEFYLSRLKRIVPAYVALLAIVSGVMAVLLTPDDFRFFEKSLKAAAYFNSNQYFAGFGNYFAPTAHELPLIHTWSLAVEMQFYLILPLLLVVVPARFHRVLLPSLAMALTAYVTYRLNDPGNRQEMYFSLVARIPEFLLGSCLAIFKPGDNWSPRLANILACIGLGLVMGSFCWINESLAFPGVTALVPCLGVMLMIAARRSAISSVLSTGTMVWIGALSYSLYLWHWPILSAMRYYTGQYELQLPYLLSFALLTLGLSYLSYRWIECPFRSQGTGRSTIKRIAVVGLITVPMLTLSETLNRSVIDPLPLEQTRYAPSGTICHGTIIGDCIRGDHDSQNTLLVLGDSHAAQLNVFFDVVGRANLLAARVITGSSCVTIPGFDIERLPEWAQAPCRSQIDAAAPFLQKADKIVIAAMWQYQAQSDKFLQAFDQFLASTDARSQQVLVMAQLPMFNTNMQRMNRFERLGLPVVRTRNEEWQTANSRIAQIVAQHKSARFLDLSESELFSAAPFDEGVLIYFDNHHLNEIGSTRYGELAAPSFKDF